MLLARLRQAVQRLLDPRLVHVGDQLGQLQAGEIDLRHLGQDLEVDLELEVLALVERGHLDLRPQRRAELAVLDGLPGPLVDRLLQHLAHDRAAVLLPEQRQRRLAGPESRHPDGLLQPLQAAGDPVRDLVRRDGDLVLALEALGRELCDLHRSVGTLWGRHDAARCRVVLPLEDPGAGEGIRTPTAKATRS